MKEMNHHYARGPEETEDDLSAVVPAKPATGNPSTGLRESGMPAGTPSEERGKLASQLSHPVAIRPAGDAVGDVGPRCEFPRHSISFRGASRKASSVCKARIVCLRL